MWSTLNKENLKGMSKDDMASAQLLLAEIKSAGGGQPRAPRMTWGSNEKLALIQNVAEDKILENGNNSKTN